MKYENYPLLKNLTDKMISLMFIILFSPIFFFITAIMLLNMLLCPSDRGPFFYRERRISCGREFNIMKFRVLRQAVILSMPADDRHARLYEHDAGNLTWVGRHILKKWYFDELPQLFNILKGNMSLVGPRPWPVSLAREQIEKGFDYRNHIMAGWTGLAQLQKRIGKRYEQVSKNSTKLDILYQDYCRSLSCWKLWLLDMKIIFQTFQVMLESQGLKN